MSREFIQDQALLLLSAQVLGSKSDLYKLQKAEFLHRWRIEERGAKSAPFYGYFMRERFGPLSPQVYDAVHELTAAGLLVPTGYFRRISPLGERVATAVREHLPPSLVRERGEIGASIAPLNFDRVRDLCYPLAVRQGSEKKKIAEMQVGDEVFGITEWQQVLHDELLLDFKATIEAAKPHEVKSRRDALPVLERLLA